MIEKTTTELVAGYFFENPTTPIHLRELSRRMKLSMPTILTIIQRLRNEGIIAIRKERAWTMVQANAESREFIRLKRIHNLESLYSSGLVDAFLKAAKYPKAVVCFGSYSRGDDIERSDIDIAIIEGKEPGIPLDSYEKKLKRRVSLHNINLGRISEEFRKSLINGIVLEGAL